MYQPLKERKTFGRISALYEKARIGYPLSLINDIVAFSKIPVDASILDIGCGTGQLTIPFAERGFQVIGLDLSRDMLTIARKKCSRFPKVEFKVGTFEETEFPPQSFSLIISGMAWHWVTAEERYEKLHHLLKKGGAVALCWSHQEMGKIPFLRKVSNILDNYGRRERTPSGQRVPLHAAAAFGEFSKSSLFRAVQRKEYRQKIPFTRQGYIEMVTTYGWVQMLPPEKRDSLIQDLRKIAVHYPEPLLIPFRYIVILAKGEFTVPQKA